jgi:uncharacterized membrane protein YoaT (DUF817 family)
VRELKWFLWRQIQSSIFPLFLFVTIAGTLALPADIPRYDAILLLCILFQSLMFANKLESMRELGVICVFHLLGLCLEMYKVRHGSWSYPDQGYKINGVPFYSGFMYAAVASYMMQAWRRFDLRLMHWPSWPTLLVVCVATYANFFLSAVIGDYRWLILIFLALVFARCSVQFTTSPGKRRQMPITVSFLLIGLFVWFAEHLCTFLRAWQYPYQQESWTFVDAGKISSWTMMVILSFSLVVALKGIEKPARAPAPAHIEA